MTPNELQESAQAMLELYDKAELIMLDKVARRLSRGITETGWNEKKLSEVQRMRSELATEVKRLSKESKQLRDKFINDAYLNGMNGYDSASKPENMLNLHVIPKSRMNAVKSIIDEMDERFDAQNSMIFRKSNDAYRQIISDVVAMQSTGTITTQEAIKQALNMFADKGITSFIDSAGRSWEMASYAEMATRTGMMRASINGYTDEAKNWGDDLVIVSSHDDTCPLCMEWENRVLSMTGRDLKHPDCTGLLDDAIDAGLFHPCCLHSVTVYVEGLTTGGGSSQTRAEKEAGYNKRQEQRGLERKVRQWKRRQAVAIDPEEERRAKGYVDHYQRRIRQLISGTDLPRKYSREGGRVLLSEEAKKLPVFKVTS